MYIYIYDLDLGRVHKIVPRGCGAVVDHALVPLARQCHHRHLDTPRGKVERDGAAQLRGSPQDEGVLGLRGLIAIIPPEHARFLPGFERLEVDGGVHVRRRERDETKDVWASARGYRLLRVTNDDVFARPDWTFAAIQSFAPPR